MKTRIIHLIFVLFILSGFVFAQDFNPKEIIKRVVDMQREDSEKATMKMSLTDRRGIKRYRELMAWSTKIDENNDKKMIKFLAPADIKGSGLLTVEHSDRDDDQWLYLPALKKIRRISTAKKSGSFMGTDFSYADFTTLDVDAYTYKELNKEKAGEIMCAVIEVTPKTQEKIDETGYSKMIYWVDTKTFTVPQAKFFNKKGIYFKILTGKNLKKIGEKYRWDIMIMQDIKREHETILEFSTREVNPKLEDDIFTKRFLERGV